MNVAPLRMTPAELVDAGASPVLLGDDREYIGVPLDPSAAFPRNAYIVALYRRDRDQPHVASRSELGELQLAHEAVLAGWMLHLPWAKNPAPMNRSGSTAGWREERRQARLVREVAFQLALRRIPRQARIRVHLDWHVTTRRTRDVDNLMRCMKHLVDGIRLAGVVDDDDQRYVVREMPEILYRPAADGAYAHMRLFVLIES